VAMIGDLIPITVIMVYLKRLRNLCKCIITGYRTQMKLICNGLLKKMCDYTMESIKLTIGMPVYNDRDYMVQSMESILKQTFQDFCLIISDDASTDGTGDICKSYAHKYKRIKYIRHEKNIGISRNMQYLLSQSNTEYFMWAGDDDLYASDFIAKHINALESNPKAISAFCTCALIDENGADLSGAIKMDYNHPNAFQRLAKFIANSTDYFGYGVFRREAIKGVEFPVWWWPNRKTPYNNIYPTLCYYLSKGDFAMVDGPPIFFKRIKPESKTHHILVGSGNGVKESLAFWVRKLNLVWISLHLIRKGSGLLLSARVLPYLFYYWFIVPSYQQLKLATRSFLKNKIYTKD